MEQLISRFLQRTEQGLSNEEGFTTVGVALALLISLALIFSSAQIYELNSVSADIQEVADAAALAAENVVGEYCVIATLCDAVSLSLSLSSLTCLGIGIAAACTPLTAGISEQLISAAQKLKRAQTTFTEKAQRALEQLKVILPLVAAAKANKVIEANSGLRGGASYTGLAILTPWKTPAPAPINRNKTDEAFEEAERKWDELKDLGRKSEEAAREASQIKQLAYQHDSGSQSAYCMFERARTLAHLSGTDNPYYSSAETWGFDVALKRSQVYYRVRANIEAPGGSSVAEHARSALRKRFYQYASLEVNRGYVTQTAERFNAYFPLLPRNTAEMKNTILYTESRYPISTATSGKRVLHAYNACPQYIQDPHAGVGSIAQAEGNDAFETCPSCEFNAASMGSVASASTSIENGFEFHYRKVAELAKQYKVAREKLTNESKDLKDSVGSLFSMLKAALAQAAAARIDINPPGKYGAIAFVVTTDPGQTRFLTSLVSSTGAFRTRAALSGATLVPESTESGKTVINNILSGYGNEGAPVGIANMALDLWSNLLKGYGVGQNALITGIEGALNSVPLASESGMGKWAAEKLKGLIDDLGLQPVNLSPQKAVLVNTLHIALADNSNFSAEFANVKQASLSHATVNELFSQTLGQAEESVVDAIANAEFTIQVATIKIIEGTLEIPVQITIPQQIKDAATSQVRSVFSNLESKVASFIHMRRWQ